MLLSMHIHIHPTHVPPTHTHSSSEEDDSESEADEAELDTAVHSNGAAAAAAADTSSNSAEKNPKKKKRKKNFLKKLARTVSDVLWDKKAERRRARKNNSGLQSESWWIGRRGDCLVGLCCTNKTTLRTEKAGHIKNGVLVSIVLCCVVLYLLCSMLSIYL
jgi:hypothetical protein